MFQVRNPLNQNSLTEIFLDNSTLTCSGLHTHVFSSTGAVGSHVLREEAEAGMLMEHR